MEAFLNLNIVAQLQEDKVKSSPRCTYNGVGGEN